MTILERIIRLNNELNQLDENKPILVSYDSKNHDLRFHQLNRTIILSYISPLYLNSKNIKIGVLNQFGFNQLKSSIMDLLASSDFHEGELIPHIEELGISFYKFIRTGNHARPEKVITLKFMNITSKFWVWINCKYHSNELLILYKIIKDESRS